MSFPTFTLKYRVPYNRQTRAAQVAAVEAVPVDYPGLGAKLGCSFASGGTVNSGTDVVRTIDVTTSAQFVAQFADTDTQKAALTNLFTGTLSLTVGPLVTAEPVSTP